MEKLFTQLQHETDHHLTTKDKTCRLCRYCTTHQQWIQKPWRRYCQQFYDNMRHQQNIRHSRGMLFVVSSSLLTV